MNYDIDNIVDDITVSINSMRIKYEAVRDELRKHLASEAIDYLHLWQCTNNHIYRLPNAATDTSCPICAEIKELQDYADKLAEGLPCLPKDVEVMHQANYDLAAEVNELEEDKRRLTQMLRDADFQLEVALEELNRLQPMVEVAAKIMATAEWQEFQQVLGNYAAVQDDPCNTLS